VIPEDVLGRARTIEVSFVQRDEALSGDPASRARIRIVFDPPTGAE
jgi:hypothetical protein